MNYSLHYNKLIARARNRIIDEFTESHHIIPRCMGGTDDLSNIVDLTPEEHYLAHQLLVKIYPGNNALVRAAAMMIVNRPGNKLYGWLRKKFAAAQSIRMAGTGNSQFGTKWIYNIELRETKKIPKTEVVPKGWSLGRIIDFDLYFKKMSNKESSADSKLALEEIRAKKQLGKVETQLAEKERKDSYNEMYKMYIIDLYHQFKAGNYYSISQFHKLNNIQVSRMTLTNYWRKWIPGYKEKSKEGKRFRN
jgi:hypothetical protein